jgi:rubrerythrin
LRDKQGGPPKKGWIWGIITDPLPEHGKDDIATGWFPPDVLEIDEGGDPLIDGKPSDLPYKVTRLAGLCTAHIDTEDPIIPPEWPDLNARTTKAKSKADKRDRSAAICYEVLVKSSANLTPQQAGKLAAYSWKVQEAINSFESARTGAAAIGLDYPDGDMRPVYKHVGECVAAIEAAGRNLPAILEVLRDDISYWCDHLGDYEEEFLSLLPKGVLKAGVMTGYEITRPFQGGKKAYEIIAFRKSVEYANHIADELDKFGMSRREFFSLLRSFPGADNPKYREWRISVSGNSSALEKMGSDLIERIDEWISELSVDEAQPEMQADSEPADTKERPWLDDAPEYLTVTEAVKLTDDRLKDYTLSRLCKPDGEMRYMRKGRRCKIHAGDFRQYMRSRQSDSKWAKAYLDFRQAAGSVERRFFWVCPACGNDYPETATATERCPKCGGTAELTSKTAPKSGR